LVIAGIGGLLTYRYFFQDKNRNALELVSSEAIFVFETYEPVMAWNKLVTQSFWKELSEIPALENAERSLLMLDSLVGKSGNLERFLKGNQLSVSLHAIGKEEFDFLFVLALPQEKDFNIISDLEKDLTQLGTVSTRFYSNVSIKEFKGEDNGSSLTFARIGNLQVASATSFLVEDAIRFSQNKALQDFKSHYVELFEALPQPQGLGVVRLGSAGLASMVKGISKFQSSHFLDDFSQNDISANMELMFAEDRVIFEGNAFFGVDNNKQFLVNPTPSISLFKDYIPNRTAAYFQYQLGEINQLEDLMTSDFPFKTTVLGEIEHKLIENGFMQNLSGHVGYMLFEKNAQDLQDKILILNTREIAAQLQLLKDFNSSPESGNDFSGFVDAYQGKEILIIPTDELPAHLFNGNFSGFDDTFLTAFGDILVFANSIKAIRLFIDDYNNDNTWGKSLKHKKLLEELSSESAYSLVLDMPKFWLNILDISSPNWKSFFQKYLPQFQTFDKVQLKLNNKEKYYPISIDLSYTSSIPKSEQQVVLIENSTFGFRENLIFGPVIIQNFNDKSIEFVVQDELNIVHLITEEGEAVFTYGLDGPIISEVFQLDYYKNNKLQLLFATKNFIYGMDRFGELLPGFPVSLSQNEITHLNLLDYDNNLDYRIFVASNQGELFLLDKQLNLLEGWNPKNVHSPLAVKPAHHRLAGIGDRMVVMTTSGNLLFFNRRGDQEFGGPIRLGESLGSDYIILERGEARDNRLVTITESGEIVMANFLGEITYRNQLFRPDRESAFRLIKDQKDDRYLFVVHEYNRISVRDANYEELFAIDIFSDNLEFQFFSFGLDKNIFVVLDKTQEFIYLYDLSGELLSARPINGFQKIGMKYSAGNNEYNIYVIHGNRLSEYKLPL
jgi:hypothetical protein